MNTYKQYQSKRLNAWASGSLPIQQDFTTNKVLETEAKRLKIPLRYCWYKDQLKQLNKPGLYIINLSNQGDAGSHWCGIQVFKTPNVVFYFDSFGFPPPLNIIALIGKRPWYYNVQVIQDYRRGFCGSYVLEFGQMMNSLSHLSPQERFQRFLNLFTPDYTTNHLILRQLERD